MNAPVLHALNPATTEQALYGVVRLASMLVAVSIDFIREVVPRPAQLVPFPATMPEIQGAIELRGSIIPVLDLGAVLGEPGGQDEATIIMLLRVDDQVFGMGIHEICGVVELAQARQTPVTLAGEDAPLVLSGFAHGARHGVVLDAQRIAARRGRAKAHERRSARASAAEVGAPTLMFSAGGFHFGLAAGFIEACVPQTHAYPSPLDDPLWIGMIAYGGRRIPVVDTLLLLGLGRMDHARDYACVVVRMPGQMLVALRIDSVENILRIPLHAQLPLQGFTIGHRHLLAGLHEAAHLSLLIDGPALQAEPTLAQVSKLEERDATSSRATAAAAETGHALRHQPFLIVSTGGGSFAIPLGQVDEILPYYERDKVALPAQGNGIVGMIAHRGFAVPLYDLASHLGMWGGGSQSQYILIASAQNQRLGFLLEGLSAVERTPVQALASGQRGHLQGLPNQTIRTSDGVTCSVLDLASIIASLTLPE